MSHLQLFVTWVSWQNSSQHDSKFPLEQETVQESAQQMWKYIKWKPTYIFYNYATKKKIDHVIIALGSKYQGL